MLHYWCVRPIPTPLAKRWLYIIIIYHIYDTLSCFAVGVRIIVTVQNVVINYFAGVAIQEYVPILRKKSFEKISRDAPAALTSLLLSERL